MPPVQNEQLQDAAVLTRAIENLFRKLIRFLVGRLSLVKLQELIRYIYVEEAEGKLRKEKPGRDIPLTRLALLTGLDTRTLAKVRNSDRYRKPMYQENRFIKAMTPKSCVLDIWTSHSQFRDPDTGKPKQIVLRGSEASFEQLVKEAVTSRGVTSQSILASLIADRAVELDEGSQKVTLLEKIQAPYKSGNEWGTLEVGLLHTCSLLDTVFHNFEAVRNGSATLYQQGCWTHRLKKEKRLDFQKIMRAFMEKSDDEARECMLPYEEKISHEDQLTAGISMFYFEEGMKPN
jgi:hypothetical protein